MKWYIKERDNPQLGTYYVALGKMPKKEANLHLKTIYGYNTIHSFDTEAKYLAELKSLEDKGYDVTR